MPNRLNSKLSVQGRTLAAVSYGRKVVWATFITLCVCTIAFCFILTVWTIGPSVESNFWPVTSKLKIVSLTETPEGFSVLSANFRKYRDCEYIGISWYQGDRINGFAKVSTMRVKPNDDTPLPRSPAGLQSAGPWEIKLTNDQLLHNSFAILTHRCHPFWVTTTYFYPDN